MKQICRWFVLSSLIFISALSVQGQKITVFGWIKDSSNLEAITGASVSFKAYPGIRSAGVPHFLSVFSDESGYFECRQIEPDSYRLQMNVIGFQSFSKEVVLTADTPVVNLGVFFLPPNSQRIQEVVVDGVRKVLDFKPDRIIYNVAQDPDRLTSPLTDLLQKIPMITLGPNESVQIKGRSDYKILIDGRPARGGGLSEILKSFPASSVKRIELITSPGSRYDAEGTSAGIINIVTGKRLTGYNGSINMIGSTLNRHSESYFITAKRNKIGVLGFGTIGGGENSVKSTFVRENHYEQPLRREMRSGEGNARDFSYSSSLEIAYDIDSLTTISLYGSGLKYDIENRLLNNHVGIGNQGAVTERGIYDDSAFYRTTDFQTGCDYIRKFKKEVQEFSLLTAFRRKKSDSERSFDRIFELGQPDAYIFQPRNKQETELILEANYVQPVSSNSTWSWGAKMIDRTFTHQYIHAEKNAETDTFLVTAGQSGIFNYRQQGGLYTTNMKKNTKNGLSRRAFGMSLRTVPTG